MEREDETQDDEFDGLGLGQFEQVRDDQGLSLEELGRAFAEMIGVGSDPYEPESADGQTARTGDDAPEEDAVACELTPTSIVEAILFVGHPDNEPMNANQLAGLMRGVRATEIDDLVAELNEAYDVEGHAFHITTEGSGYRMVLRDKFAAVRDAFHGRVRDARLSQASIDILAIVAYRPGLTRNEVDDLRGKLSGGLLGNLVRRDLLRIERPESKPRVPRYFVTDRFLELFRLQNLDELPRGEDDERLL